MASPQRIGLYSKSSEAIHIAWPIAIVCVAAISLALGSRLADLNVERSLRLVAALLFLNVIHNAFTLHLIFGTTEMREWLRYRSGNFVNGLLFRWGMLFAGLFAVLHYWYSHRNQFSPLLATITTFLSLVPFMIHTVRQQFGLSLLYNRETERMPSLTEEDRTQLRRVEIRERALFRFLLASFMAGVGFASFGFNTNAAVFCGITFLISLGIIANSRFYPMAQRSNKTLYLVRTLSLSLVPLNPVAALSTKFVHGFEYLFLFQRMRGNSATGRESNWLLYSLVSVVAFLLLFEPTQGMGWITGAVMKNESFFFHALAAASMGISLMHVYLDGVIFRMSDPETRRAINKLLYPKESVVEISPACLSKGGVAVEQKGVLATLFHRRSAARNTRLDTPAHH